MGPPRRIWGRTSHIRVYIYSAPDLGLLSHFQFYGRLAQPTPLYYQFVDPVDVVMLSSEDSFAHSSPSEYTSDSSSSVSATPTPSASSCTFGGLSSVQHLTPLPSPVHELPVFPEEQLCEVPILEEHVAPVDVDMAPPIDPVVDDIIMIDTDSSATEEIPQGIGVVMIDSSSSENEEKPSEGDMVI